MDVWVIAITALVVAINVAATVALLRSSVASRKQQIAQLAIIWLVPVFGAAVIGIYYYSIARNETLQATSLRNEQEDPGVNLYPPHGPSDS